MKVVQGKGKVIPQCSPLLSLTGPHLDVQTGTSTVRGTVNRRSAGRAGRGYATNLGQQRARSMKTTDSGGYNFDLSLPVRSPDVEAKA